MIAEHEPDTILLRSVNMQSTVEKMTVVADSRIAFVCICNGTSKNATNLMTAFISSFVEIGLRGFPEILESGN